MAVTIVWAVKPPTPGMVASRRIAGSALATAMIMSGRPSAMQVAAASRASFLLRRTNGFT